MLRPQMNDVLTMGFLALLLATIYVAAYVAFPEGF